MRVSNLTSPRSGEPVKNQFTVTDGNTEYFQSYETMIAKKDGMAYTISSDWEYSNTTNKYFGQWLRSWGFTETEIKTLKKWLKKDSTKDGSELVELVGGRVSIKYVDSL